VLANRPGFPFLGNDLFSVCGSVFSVHIIPNPDTASMRTLLRHYGPDVPEPVLTTLAEVSACAPSPPAHTSPHSPPHLQRKHSRVISPHAQGYTHAHGSLREGGGGRGGGQWG
jgi:hypothetical protein